LASLFQRNIKVKPIAHCLVSGLYLLITLALVVLFFPVLWTDPLGGLVNGLKEMGNFPWSGGSVLYRGLLVDATQLPGIMCRFGSLSPRRL